jgi:hypothetical protein
MLEYCSFYLNAGTTENPFLGDLFANESRVINVFTHLPGTQIWKLGNTFSFLNNNCKTPLLKQSEPESYLECKFVFC